MVNPLFNYFNHSIMKASPFHLLIVKIVQCYTHVSRHIRASVVVIISFRQEIYVMENYAVVFPVFCCFIETDVPHQTAIELQTPVCYFPNLRKESKIPNAEEG